MIRHDGSGVHDQNSPARTCLHTYMHMRVCVCNVQICSSSSSTAQGLVEETLKKLQTEEKAYDKVSVQVQTCPVIANGRGRQI